MTVDFRAGTIVWRNEDEELHRENWDKLASKPGKGIEWVAYVVMYDGDDAIAFYGEEAKSRGSTARVN